METDTPHRQSQSFVVVYMYLIVSVDCIGFDHTLFMRPSSLGGGRILRRTLSVCLSVCPSVPLSLPSVTSFRQPLASRMYCPASVTSRHLANYNDTDVLFGTHWGPHIVRPSRLYKQILVIILYSAIFVASMSINVQYSVSLWRRSTELNRFSICIVDCSVFLELSVLLSDTLVIFV